MMIERGGLYWAELSPAAGNRSPKRRPVLVIQADPYNRSRLATVLVAVVTSNTALATLHGNTFLPAAATGLPRDSVVNVTALVTLNETDLSDPIGTTPPSLMLEVERGLRRVLDLVESESPTCRSTVDIMSTPVPFEPRCSTWFQAFNLFRAGVGHVEMAVGRF